jgi:hypothetical protein
MTAATADTAADYGPDLAPVTRLPQHDSLTAMTAATTDSAADYGLDLESVSRPRRRDSLKGVTAATDDKAAETERQPITREQWLLVRKLFSKRSDVDSAQANSVTPLRRVNLDAEEPANDGTLLAHGQISPVLQNVC